MLLIDNISTKQKSEKHNGQISSGLSYLFTKKWGMKFYAVSGKIVCCKNEFTYLSFANNDFW